MKQAIITLCVKQPLFIKSGFLEAVIHICGYDKIILLLDPVKQSLEDGPAPAPITRVSAFEMASDRRLACSEELSVDFHIRVFENIKYHLHT